MTAGDKGAAPPEGLDGRGLRIGVVRARWNSHIVDRLAEGVGRGLSALGVDPGDVVDETVPGSFELPMGARILASSGRVRLFNLERFIPVSELVALAQQRVKRDWTPGERKRFLHETPND